MSLALGKVEPTIKVTAPGTESQASPSDVSLLPCMFFLSHSENPEAGLLHIVTKSLSEVKAGLVRETVFKG